VNNSILPGSKIGVLGSGQLGRMFAIAARRMGYMVHTFSPDSDSPTGQISDVEISSSYDDLNALREFASNVDVVTFEFENIPSASVELVSQYVPVRPSGQVLHITQNRVREKTFISKAGFPVTPFRHVHSLEDLVKALNELGYPAILKTAGFGYDGKGQRSISSVEEAEKAFLSIGGQEAILEAFVDFECELSVVAARGLDGRIINYGVVENTHRNHILDYSVAPANIPPHVAKAATEIAESVLEQLDVIGVLCVEFFLKKDGSLYINELAPRPHNSGHFTFDACITSQFEQQLRTVCGLPLGAPDILRPAAMANILGDLWQAGEPKWEAVCSIPNVKLHLYGKRTPSPGRKMGHLTALASTAHEALNTVRLAREMLTN
jgi:5-(carboxyamino)imidazole ribonucleotide synthase